MGISWNRYGFQNLLWPIFLIIDFHIDQASLGHVFSDLPKLIQNLMHFSPLDGDSFKNECSVYYYVSRLLLCGSIRHFLIKQNQNFNKWQINGLTLQRTALRDH